MLRRWISSRMEGAIGEGKAREGVMVVGVLIGVWCP